METHNYAQNAANPALADLPGCKTVAGAKQIRKAVAAGKAKKVFLASNADPALTEPIFALCQEKAVPCCWVQTMSALGQACGLEVGSAAAAALI